MGRWDSKVGLRSSKIFVRVLHVLLLGMSAIHRKYERNYVANPICEPHLRATISFHIAETPYI